jgi:glycine dehydrogenase
MLSAIGVDSLADLIDRTVPDQIRSKTSLNIPNALSEDAYLKFIEAIGAKNQVLRSFIGQGYYGTITPSVIKRNIFENPGWYTQYTPYQAEISQGRLEALLNFQTVVSDLTGLPIANASLLDEGTAAAEAMSMFYSIKNKRAKDNPAHKIFIDHHVFPQTISVIKGRALPLDIDIEIGDYKTQAFSDEYFAALVQYPNAEGNVADYTAFSENVHAHGMYLIVAADIMSLAILKEPGAFGADAVVGNTQRLGVPMGYGGPHAAFFATQEDHKRSIPGRIIGISIDMHQAPALRMALQTREQHIKREKATSNICTAQALLAIMAGMYAVYHGPDGLRDIAKNMHENAKKLAKSLHGKGFRLKHNSFFDTIAVELANDRLEELKKIAVRAGYNFLYESGQVQISLDETTTQSELDEIGKIFQSLENGNIDGSKDVVFQFDPGLERTSEYLTHEVFHAYHSETEMMRYIKHLENKDLSLIHSMIPLGSCTMKLNAATQLMPLSWPEWSSIHPFVPKDQAMGYHQIFDELEAYLCEITGFTACSLQPNSGAQGELSGLLTIRAYHHDRNEDFRDVALIPSSAHGTNPASAIMAGMQVVVVKCDEEGNIDIQDLEEKAIAYREKLAALMVTYPSTHGVFETGIKKICDIIHQYGGLVYMDGANMNAQVGLTSPGLIHADVCHLNLHKTFAIPHGGGGPGMGPICVNDKLAPYLPGHPMVQTGGTKAVEAVAAAPWGSASILLISYAYIRLLGDVGLTEATRYAILNSNYIKSVLEKEYQVLYTGEHGFCAHELIIDLRPFKNIGISAEDVAKRLIDYGFHAPTLSFPVAGTIMIEPTESESKGELDRFCEAMLQIKSEIDEVARGEADPEDNVLVNAPHTLGDLLSESWNRPYTREKAAYPLPYLRSKHKFWAPVGRINNAFGDRNLVCTCPPTEMYAENGGKD